MKRGTKAHSHWLHSGRTSSKQWAIKHKNDPKVAKDNLFPVASNNNPIPGLIIIQIEYGIEMKAPALIGSKWYLVSKRADTN